MLHYVNDCLLSCRTTLEQARSLMSVRKHKLCSESTPLLIGSVTLSKLLHVSGTPCPHLWKWDIYPFSEKVGKFYLKIMKRSLVNYEVKKVSVITVRQDSQLLTPFYGRETKDKIKKLIVPGVTGRKWYSLDKDSGPSPSDSCCSLPI